MDELREVTSRLVPYDTNGDTLEALGELQVLGRSLDPRTAATARFLRAAAAVDLIVYARLTRSVTLLGDLSDALDTTADEMVNQIEVELSASRGSFAVEAASCQTVLSCASGQDWERCSTQLGEVASSNRAGSTAARLLLFERMVQAAEQARGSSSERASALLAEAGARVCEAPSTPTVADHCADSATERDELLRQAALVQAVTGHTVHDVQTLRRFATGGDPMARLSSSWLERAMGRIGWSIVTQPFSPSSFADLTLPPSASPSTLPPLELLVISRTGVSVALAPATVVTAMGPFRLDERVGVALPGRQVVALPARFRAVVRPIPPITEALRELREGVAQALRPLGASGPTWLTTESPALGLIVDRSVTLIDLARYVVSAQRAGYESFALLGLRDDGQLGVISAEFGTMRAGPEPADLPRLRIGPREVGFAIDQGHTVTLTREEFAASAPSLAGHLSQDRRAFAAQGRLALGYGVVFSPIDALMSSAPRRPPPVLVLLPP